MDDRVLINRLSTDAAMLHARASQKLREAEAKERDCASLFDMAEATRLRALAGRLLRLYERTRAKLNVLRAQQPGFVPDWRRRCSAGGGGQCKEWGVALAHGGFYCLAHAQQAIASYERKPDASNSEQS